MPDLTDSYCERCGARYVFGEPPPKGRSLRSARVVARGLRNFVLTDGQSLGDSIALARHDDEHDGVRRATEAFHKTFNFCMTCRQYACSDCWNERQGACLTCAPEEASGPVAPQNHLIVRMPVAHLDASGGESPFGDGERLDIAFGKQPQAGPPPGHDGRSSRPAWTESLAPSPMGISWPSADLDEPRPTLDASAASEAAEKEAARAEGWTLWPTADPLAPEMTLTPDELRTVQAQLDRDLAGPDAAIAPELPRQAEQPPIAPPPVAPPAVAAQFVQPAPPPPAQVLFAPPPPAQAAEVQPAAALFGEGQSWPAAAPSPAPPPAATSPTLAPSVHPAGAESASGAEPQSARPLGVGRMFGRMTNRSAAAANTPPAGPDRKPAWDPATSTPSSDPWPHATVWAERPVKESPLLRVPDQGPAGPENRPAVSLPPAAGLPEETGTARELAEVRAAAVPDATQPRPFEMPEPAPQPAEPPVGPPVPGFPPVTVPLPPAAPAPIAAAPPSAPSPIAPIPPAPFAPGRWEPLPLKASPAPNRSARPPMPRQPATATPAPAMAQQPAPLLPPLGNRWPPTQQPGQVWPAPASSLQPAAMLSQMAATQVSDALWAQSSQEVLNRGSVRVCHHCSLPLSTHARFCRRCGTAQA
jgi:ribosomal protein L40E